MKILGLIPARGGSKGIPGKNIRLLHGKPLLQYAYEAATASGVLDRIILSTDDPAIAELAKRLGIEVPFMRPPDLASDQAPMIGVAVHALRALEEDGYVPDALMLLQPTAPLRRPEHIRDAVALLGDNDAVTSVVPLPKDQCPHFLMRITPEGRLTFFMPDGATYTRRQDVPQAYQRDGSVYLTRRDVLLNGRTFYGTRTVPLVIDPADSANIDGPEDWERAEALLRARER